MRTGGDTGYDSSQCCSGNALDVFGTPILVALVEKTCFMCMAQASGEGEASVGVTLDITHSSPTPVGMKVSCTAKVEKVDKKMVTFSYEAVDEAGVIGTGTHVGLCSER